MNNKIYSHINNYNTISKDHWSCGDFDAKILNETIRVQNLA